MKIKMGNICKTEYNKIKNNYGNYLIGNLYVSNANSQTIEQNPCEKVFDTDNFNYHMYPKDDAYEKKIAAKIKILRSKVIECLKDAIENENLGMRDLKINTRKGCQARVSPLYLYIYTEKNGIVYEINFMRFFISNDENSINCILSAIQFDCCHKGTLINQDKDDTNKCHINYPTSYQGQETYLDKIIDEFQTRNFCYNPPIYFSLDDLMDGSKELCNIAKRISSSFINFIKQCENKGVSK